MDIRQVIDRYDRAHDERDVEDITALLLGQLQFLLAHGAVGAAEVRRFFGHLLDAAAGADRLVVDFDAAGFVVLVGPLGHHRVDEGGAGAIETRLGRSAAADAERGQGEQGCRQQERLVPHGSSPLVRGEGCLG